MDYWITKILHVLFVTNVYSQQFFNTMPPPVNTNFTCRGRDTGFYADVETNCRVYHTCDDHGNKFTYYCPAETAFRQEALVCDHAHLVDCANGRRISRLMEIAENYRDNTDHKIGYNKVASSMRGTISKDDFSYGQDGNGGEKNVDSFQPGSSNSAYTRSFRITPEPTSQFSVSKSSNGPQQPTFSLNSSFFLRSTSNFKKHPENSQIERGAMGGLKNSHNSEPSLIQNFSKRVENEDYSKRFSSMDSTTTFRPFGRNFKAKSNFRTTGGFRSSLFDNEEEKTDANSDKFLLAITTSTSIPFGDHYRVKENFGKFPSFEKFKFNRENIRGNERNPASRIQLDHEGMNSRKLSSGFQFDDERKNDKKIELSDDFRDHARNHEKEDGFGELSASVPKDSNFSKNGGGFNKNSKEQLKVRVNERPSFFFDSGNFPYSETLRSMQTGNAKSLDPNSSSAKVDSVFASTTSAPTATAGTEFPVHPFVGSLSALIPNELEDDPYYPRRSTTTEVYYKLSDLDRDGKKTSSFSTKRPWPGSVNFEIPEVLPDLNTLDDLVDRRKLFYIPRVKAT